MFQNKSVEIYGFLCVNNEIGEKLEEQHQTTNLGRDVN